MPRSTSRKYIQGEGRCPGEGDDRIGVAVRESTETYVVVKTETIQWNL